jgi:hypothetical protein
VLEFLIDDISVEVGRNILLSAFQWEQFFTFFFSFSDMRQLLYKNISKSKELQKLNTLCWHSDCRSITILTIANWIVLIYPLELEIREATETTSFVSFLNIYLKFDINCQLSTRLYHKRDDFNFAIINFPHLDSNNPITRIKFIFHSSSCVIFELCQFVFRLTSPSSTKLLSQESFYFVFQVSWSFRKCQHLFERWVLVKFSRVQTDRAVKFVPKWWIGRIVRLK